MCHRYLLNVRNFDVTAELVAEYLSSPNYDKDFFMKKHLADSIERQHILSYKVEEMLCILFPAKYRGERFRGNCIFQGKRFRGNCTFRQKRFRGK